MNPRIFFQTVCVRVTWNVFKCKGGSGGRKNRRKDHRWSIVQVLVLGVRRGWEQLAPVSETGGEGADRRETGEGCASLFLFPL